MPSSGFREKDRRSDPMGDPVYLDSNVVIRALLGDPSINDQLTELRKAGRQLLITQSVENELLYGKPKATPANNYTVKIQTTDPNDYISKIRWPDKQAPMKMGMSKLGIGVDIQSNAIPPAKLAQYRMIRKDNVGEKDRWVLAEIKASAESRGIANPEFITAEL